jgi:hypothetical protein
MPAPISCVDLHKIHNPLPQALADGVRDTLKRR